MLKTSPNEVLDKSIEIKKSIDELVWWRNFKEK